MSAARWGRAVLLALAGAALIHLGRLLALSVTTSGVRRHHLETAWYIVAAVAIGLALVRRRGVADAAVAEAAFRTPSRWHSATLSGTAAACLAGILASGALYGSTLGLGLLSDDHVLVGMPILPGAHWEHVRPLPLLVWRLIEPIAGAAGLHALNVLLHGVNTALVFALGRRLAPDAPGIAWLAAGVFVSSPIAVEPIAWAAGVFDAGMAAFGLAYLLWLLPAGAPSGTVTGPASAAVAGMGFRTGLAFLCLLGALATKEAAVGLPLIAALLALRVRVSWIAVGGSLAVAVVYAAARLHGAEVPVGDSSLRCLAKEIVSRSFGAVGQPWTPGDIAGAPLLFGLAIPFGYALLLIGYAAGRFGQWRGLATAAWVLAGALPVLGFFFIDPDLAGSRYAYLPLAGWALVLAEIAWEQERPIARRAAVGFVVVVIAAGVVGGQRRLGAWREAAALRDHVLGDARRVLAAVPACRQVALLQAPDRVRGAYVFRNGLPEALGDGSTALVTTSTDAGVGAACRFLWQGDRFAPDVPAAVR